MKTTGRTRGRLAAVGAVVLVLGGVACSAAAGPLASVREAATGAKSSAPLAPAAGPAIAGGSLAPVSGQPAAQAPVADAAAARSADAVGSAAAPASTASDQSFAQSLDRMIVRTAQLNVEVPDMEPALAQARQIATRYGGFVSASNTRLERVDDQDRMVADLTLQVRGDTADTALSDLRALGNVTTESSGSQDVTEEYVDLDSNLRNLQASEAAILKLMDKATQMQDVLSMQRELTNVRGQIERIQGRKTFLERRTDMATITLALRLPSPATPKPATPGWDPLGVAQRGWQASLTVLRGAAEIAIVVIAFSWWLIPLVALGAYVVVRRRRTPVAAVPATEA